MLIVTRMKLVLEGEEEMPLPDISVALFDRDESDPDDFLAKGLTDQNGEILFKFDSSRYTDFEDGPEWRSESLPDLYVVLYDRGGNAVYNTRSQTEFDKLPKKFTIVLPYDVAEGNKLL